ncbi:MAG: sulfatase-like hydrolase/transferase [Lachnospiraceae bacterium]|nr:sulfatase-like hydrolase/transferase [Lachnospiraceae bacterium]
MMLLGVLAGVLLYMEVVYHLGCFGFSACNPIFAFVLILTAASFQALMIGNVPGKWKKRVFGLFLLAEYILFAAQMVYMGIFKQPLLWEAMVRGGQDALTNYWREALYGILNMMPFLIILALPLITVFLVYGRKKRKLPKLGNIGRLRMTLCTVSGVALAVMVMVIGKNKDAHYYESYSEFYDPITVISEMGVLATIQRDTARNLANLGEQGVELLVRVFEKEDTELAGKEESGDGTGDDDRIVESTETDNQGESIASEEIPTEEEPDDVTGETEGDVEKQPDTSPNQLPIDFEMLRAAAAGKETTWLAEYIEGLTPTTRNAYTGIFEGHNLIFLTAEGFSPYAVREDLTPTLYRLVHAGFDFTNYYVPLWQTSTSDGEYVNLTGMIPDGQFSMRKTGSNDMSFALPGYFGMQGAGCMAYHNNSMDYYDRHKSHNNLGYVYKASKLGKLDPNQWGQFIFPMENPGRWPASDLEMVQGTVSEYLGWDQFHVYYMTVSGHMNYNFRGNSMASKNREAVSGLDMSENAKAYIACHIELDKALEYLIEELTAAGKLENTVICLSADHYPYGMEQSQYEELAGMTFTDNMDMYRNNLILWNVKLEENPQVIDKVCSSIDILPTLLNLFGFAYDSRLYAGRDIFSEEEGMVIFNDRSFVSEHVICNKKAKQTIWKEDSYTAEEQELYLKQKQQDVKDRYQFSAYMLRNDYYARIKEALPIEYHNDAQNPAWELLEKQAQE